MKKTLLLLCLITSLSFAKWMMYSDSGDTYMYNTETGEAYRFFRNTDKKGDILYEGFTSLKYERIGAFGYTPKDLHNAYKEYLQYLKTKKK